MSSSFNFLSKIWKLESQNLSLVHKLTAWLTEQFKLYTVYIVFSVYTVYTMYTFYTMYTVYTMYTMYTGTEAYTAQYKCASVYKWTCSGCLNLHL